MARTRPTLGARRVVMLCTEGRGGMRAVVEGYRSAGLFERYRVQWLVTHTEGPAWRRVWVALRAWLQFVWMLVRGEVAAVHTHMAMRGSFWRKSFFNATARAFKVPVIAHLHGSEFKQFHAALSSRLRRRVAREFERCRAVLVLSQSWADFVRGIAPGAHVVIMPNHVPLPEMPARVAAPDAAASVTVLFLGVVGDRKGVFDLLPALARALEEAPRLHLLIGGNGEVERARQVAVSLGVADQVQFLGWVSGPQKRAALQTADVYVLPSHNEGLPVSILEAMSYGLPIIATQVGGIPELVRDGIDGRLVTAGDVPALAAALVSLAQSPEQRRSFGQAARQRVAAQYSDEVVLPRLFKVYDDLLRSGGPTP